MKRLNVDKSLVGFGSFTSPNLVYAVENPQITYIFYVSGKDRTDGGRVESLKISQIYALGCMPKIADATQTAIARSTSRTGY